MCLGKPCHRDLCLGIKGLDTSNLLSNSSEKKCIHINTYIENKSKEANVANYWIICEFLEILL